MLVDPVRLDLPGLPDRAVGIEEERDPARDLAPLLGLPDDPELGNQPPRGIGQELEAQPLLGAELRVQLLRVDARAENLDAGFAKLREELVEAPHFARSAACQR